MTRDIVLVNAFRNYPWSRLYVQCGVRVHGICIYLHSTAAERECGGSSEIMHVSACMAIYNKCQQLMLVGVALRLGRA